MKRSYQKPIMEMETFAPNEYIAACYAIVNKNNRSEFVIKKNWNGEGTDGQNRQTNGLWYWRGNGFEDDHLDKLEVGWEESHTDWFYNGPGMTLTTQVTTWEANGDSVKGGTKKNYMATPVDFIKVTEENHTTYDVSANAS